MSQSSESSNESTSHHPSIAELRSSQNKRLELIEKTRKSMKSTACSLPSSRTNSKPGRSNKRSKQSSKDYHRDVRRASTLRRSQSLITLPDLAISQSKGTQFFIKGDAITPTISESAGDNASKTGLTSDSDDDAESFNTFPLMSSRRSKSMQKHRHRSISHSRSPGHEWRNSHQLRKAAERLHEVLTNVQDIKSRSKKGICSENSRFKEVPSVASLHERTKLDDIASTIDILSEQLQDDVSSFIVLTSKDKDCLKELRKDNASLNLQLQKALHAQTTLEAKLSQLSKEKSFLEHENKNLAIQMAPLISGSSQQDAKLGVPSSRINNGDENRNFSGPSLPSVSRESNRFHRDSGKGSDVGNLLRKKSRWSSRLLQKYNVPSSTPSKTSLVSGELSENDVEGEVSCNENNFSHRDELDSITSYVRKKREDVGRLEGELHKYQETTKKLRQKISHLSKEHQVTLSDFGDIVESYRELEEERDNYECILKLILKEKSSSESNLHALLDDLIKQLSSTLQNISPDMSMSDNDNNSDFGHDYSTTSKYNRFSSKDFLQSVLQVIQGHNISLREEMTVLRESLHETTGQNVLLQSNNEGLVEKVQDMKKQLEVLEVKDQETEEKSKELREKYDELDKLYQAVLSAKTDLETTLKGKERELTQLQKLTDKSRKEVGGQNEKILKLQNDNDKMGREATKLRIDIEELNQTIFNLRACLKDESGIWCERLKTAARDISNSKDQCKWLQSQIDKLSAQLKDAHGRIKLHEQDKAILAQKVISAEEERKTLNRKILEIKSIMHGDTVYREALAERNEVLQLKINHLRKKTLSCECTEKDSESDADSNMTQLSTIPEDKVGNSKDNEKRNGNGFSGDHDRSSNMDELSPLGSTHHPGEKMHHVPNKDIHVSSDVTPLSRKYYSHQHRRHHRGTSPGGRKFSETPRAAYHLCLQQVSLHNPTPICYKGK